MFFKRAKKPENKNNAGKVKYIIAGLGNPGERYARTRHNAGFLTLDYISRKYNFKIDSVKFKSYCAKYHIDNTDSENPENSGSFDALFMKPQTYMNNSGEAISEAARFYKIPPENILVISDDITLPAGKLRIRKNGSDGGHNGLKSIIEHLSSDNFPRIKIGVGEKPHPDYDLADWVTSGFSKDEEKIISDALSKACDCADMFLKEIPIDRIQNKYN